MYAQTSHAPRRSQQLPQLQGRPEPPLEGQEARERRWPAAAARQSRRARHQGRPRSVPLQRLARQWRSASSAIMRARARPRRYARRSRAGFRRHGVLLMRERRERAKTCSARGVGAARREQCRRAVQHHPVPRGPRETMRERAVLRREWPWVEPGAQMQPPHSRPVPPSRPQRLRPNVARPPVPRVLTRMPERECERENRRDKPAGDDAALPQKPPVGAHCISL
jgi:hypothetical protein